MTVQYDADLFIIGAGSGGVRAARFAGQYGAKVIVAENKRLGGTCVNLGCVPKKMLVYGASYADDFSDAAAYGWATGPREFSWSTLIANKDRQIAWLNGYYDRLLDQSEAKVVQGSARFVDSHTVDVAGERYTAKHILIATGGEPQLPDIPGAERAISSDEAFGLPALPGRVVVVGGGYIATEFACIFHGMGARVRQVYRGDLFLRGFDDSVRSHLADQLRLKGLDLQFNADVSRIEKRSDDTLLVHLNDGRALEADCVLFATGRRPALSGLGLENTDVRLDARGFVAVDEQFRTSDASIYAIGDVIGRMQLTPVALAEGMAVAKRLFKPEDYRPVDYALVPTAVFSLPNVGTVGLTESDARRAGHELKIFETRIKPLKATLTRTKETSFLKLVVDARTDRVLGCHMVGPDAGEVIQGLAVALKAGATKAVFDETIGIHPTIAEEFVTMRTPVVMKSH